MCMWYILTSHTALELGAHGLVKAVGAGEMRLPIGPAVGVAVVGRTVDDTLVGGAVCSVGYREGSELGRG